MMPISANLQDVRARIQAAEARFGKVHGSVQLLAVSKKWPADCVRDARAAGQNAFGESYVQEGIDKIAALSSDGQSGLEWHFIGPLQSNKSRLVAEHFDWVHSVDRMKIAERLSQQRPAERTPLNICLQVNVSGEASKSGCSPRETLALAHAIAELPQLQLRGLMCIPEPTDDFASQRQPFRQLREMFDVLRAAGLPLDTLSMGMSHDLEAAIAEGATMVRIGTAIFGVRNTNDTTTKTQEENPT